MITKYKQKEILRTSFLFFLVIFSCKAEIKEQNSSKQELVETNIKTRDSLVIEPLIEFNKKIHDFGKMKKDDSVSTIFSFRNISDKPIIIEEVKASCGCTIPEWPNKEIMAGKQGQIKVSYDAKKPFRFYKTINVFYNGGGSSIELIIKGEVLFSKEQEKKNYR